MEATRRVRLDLSEWEAREIVLALEANAERLTPSSSPLDRRLAEDRQALASEIDRLAPRAVG